MQIYLEVGLTVLIGDKLLSLSKTNKQNTLTLQGYGKTSPVKMLLKSQAMSLVELIALPPFTGLDSCAFHSDVPGGNLPLLLLTTGVQ